MVIFSIFKYKLKKTQAFTDYLPKKCTRENIMKLRILLVLSVFMTLAFAGSAIARKPAVEDVVGVEPESYKTTSIGTEVKFNFGNFIQGKVPAKANVKQTNQTPPWLATSTLLAFISLPFFMWFAVARSVKGLDVAQEQTAAEVQVTKHDNVAKLSDYQNKPDDKDKKDGGKKAA